MKIRSDFVSNSSSSSFIIGEFQDGFVSCCKLTKADFTEAIADLWPKNRPLIDGSTFYILDKKCDEDNKVVKSEKTSYLKHWTNVLMTCSDRFNDWMHNKTDIKNYLTAYNAFRDVYSLPYTYDFHGKNFCSSYDSNTGLFTRTPVPEFVDRVVRDMRSYYGVKDNYETLMSDDARFLLHFDDNEILELEGMSVPGQNERFLSGNSEYARSYNEQITKSEWATDAQTVDRICEVFFKWFKTHGKLKNCVKREDGGEWTWQNLFYDVMAATLHEG